MPAPLVVHLVHPPPYGEVPFKHLGLCYVAAGLNEAGFDTEYHDLSERHHRAGRDFYDDLILRLSERAGIMSDLPLLDLVGEVLFPDHRDSALAATIRSQVREAETELATAKVVGISFNTLTSYFSIALGRALRNHGIRVMMGGPLAGIRPVSELVLRLGAAQVIIAGEGDRTAALTVQALVENRAPHAVPGAIWLDGPSLRSNPVDDSIVLDSLPHPSLQGNVIDQFFPIQASRGCARACAYCSERGIWNRQGDRRRSPPHVVAEMVQRASLHPLRDFHFHDDLLNCNRRFMDELVRDLEGRNYTWESFFEPYGFDADLLSRMRNAGCRLVKYGIQSFSPALLRRMRRPTAIQGVVDTVVSSYRLGISTHYDMLVGHPGETEEDHRVNLRLVEELYSLTGNRLYFSINPFYLSAGSEIERHPERFGVTIEHANPDAYPPEICQALAQGPLYPIGYLSDVPRETTMRRMSELAEVLRRHGKDYLYLGQSHVPNVAEQPRRMLPATQEAGDAAISQTTRDARARGDADLALPALVLHTNSNLRLFPHPGRPRLITPESAPLRTILEALERMPVGAKLRILGGEASLSPDMARVLVASQRLVRTPLLETNGLRFARKSFTEAMVRCGLSHAVVLLLGIHPRSADTLGGVDGAFELALSGTRNLLQAGVHVQVGLTVSPPTLEDVPRLSDFVHQHIEDVSELRIVVTDLVGPNAPDRVDPEGLERTLASLLEEAHHHSQTVILEDRG